MNSWRIVSACLLIGSLGVLGCGAADPTPLAQPAGKKEHTHFHVHGAGIEHGHDHAGGSEAHSHEHLHSTIFSTPAKG